MIRKLLIANRGEIALRIQRTARRLGIRTVAVYSEADRNAWHALAADEAVPIGAAAAADSYLRGERIIAAARRCGADAIHPGYGFLSENAEFAAACRAASIEFVGPDERALRVMGSKSAAKDAVRAARVPVLPGYPGDAQDDATLAREADRIGYPLLVKAVAGGGGKGMRVVRAAPLLGDALAAARREARAAFGDDRVMLERFLDRPRHVEVQVFGDRHGQFVHLHERDCSLQRRHQKVIEEAPAPFLGADLRARICQDAVAVAKSVAYVGAGTVEFLVQDDEYWFIEMNTRLQVEHPVTEAITGLDLVEWQLRVASGEPLPLAQAQIAAQGHAIELRLCAEDSARGLLPAIGTLTCFEQDEPQPPWCRFDTGFRGGDHVTPHYDSMLAKLIVQAPDRATAIDRAREALAELRVAGVPSNRSFLDVLLQLPAWQRGGFDTNLIEREQASLLEAAAARDRDPPAAVSALLAVALALPEQSGAAGSAGWDAGDAFRMNQPPSQILWIGPDAQRIDLTREATGAWKVRPAGGAACQVANWSMTENRVRAEVDGERWSGHLLLMGDRATWAGRGGSFSLERHRQDAGLAGPGATTGGKVLAPMPGTVLGVHVAAGDVIERGTRLITLEAMKMEHTLTAQAAGRVAAVHVSAGQRVADGAALLDLSSD
jgi:3-methylcrotonyl-CoA carboxylase alpha subunit